MKVVPSFASLTAFAVGIKQPVRAEGSEIVHALHDGDSQRGQQVINRRGNQRIDVVNVCYFGIPFRNRSLNVTLRSERINRVENKANLLRNAEGAEFVVMSTIEQHRMTALFKKRLFREWNCVLPSKYLIEIVN
jgi:hypothetical protein